MCKLYNIPEERLPYTRLEKVVRNERISVNATIKDEMFPMSRGKY